MDPVIAAIKARAEVQSGGAGGKLRAVVLVQVGARRRVKTTSARLRFEESDARHSEGVTGQSGAGVAERVAIEGQNHFNIPVNFGVGWEKQRVLGS